MSMQRKKLTDANSADFLAAQTVIKSHVARMCVLSNGYIVSVIQSRDVLYYKIHIFDPNKNLFVSVIKISGWIVPHLLPLPDGRLAFCTSQNRQLAVWDPHTLKRQLIYEAQGDKAQVQPLCWFDSKQVLCQLKLFPGLKLGIINIDTKEFSEIQNLITEYGSIAAAYVRGESFVTVTDKGYVDLWDTRTKTRTANLFALDGQVHGNQSSISLMNNLLMVLVNGFSLAASIKILDLTKQLILNDFDIGLCPGAILLPGDRLAVANIDNLQIFDVHSQTLLSTFPVPNILFMQLLPDFNLLVGGHDQLAIINIGLREALQKEFSEYQQAIAGNTPITPDPAGVIVEYLVDERKKIFGTRNSDAKTQDTSLSSDETPKNKGDNPSDKEDRIIKGR